MWNKIWFDVALGYTPRARLHRRRLYELFGFISAAFIMQTAHFSRNCYIILNVLPLIHIQKFLYLNVRRLGGGSRKSVHKLPKFCMGNRHFSVTRLCTPWPRDGGSILGRSRYFFFISTTSWPSLGPTSLLCSRYPGFPPNGVKKRPRREGNHNIHVKQRLNSAWS
jgi:hypothetical protein